MRSSSSIYFLMPLIVVVLYRITWYVFMAVIIGGLGIVSVVWPFRAVAFCRWYHLKKPKWVQDLPFADMVMRPWMPTYFRIMGVFFCLVALGLLWIAITGDFSN
jgi:hypothetical protein